MLPFSFSFASFKFFVFSCCWENPSYPPSPVTVRVRVMFRTIEKAQLWWQKLLPKFVPML